MKIPVFEFDKKTSMDVQEALEDVRMLLNNGKYTPSIITTEPTYTGEEGEFLVFSAGPTSKYLFVYTGSVWWYVALTQGPLP